MTESIYRRLQQHFDGFPLRFPETESGVEIRLLKRLFTPEEAEIACRIKFGHWGSLESMESLEKIFKRVKKLGYTIEDVEKHLDNMVSKGAILGTTKNGVKLYANTLLVLGIYELQVDKLTKEFLEDFYQYMREAWGIESSKVKVSQMRTIPVGIKIDHENPIAKYDDIKVLFDQSEGPFTIINCICR